MLYTGIDLIEINRIEQAVARWGNRFLCRVFTSGELDDSGAQGAMGLRVPSLAARWAAKEAAAKMLGLGVRGIGAQAGRHGDAQALGWHELEVCRTPAGRPLLLLHGRAAAAATTLGISEISLSLSHTRQHAIASVVAWGVTL